MKKLQKLTSLLLAVIMTFAVLTAASASKIILPAALTQIENEAFVGDISLQGLVELPGTVTSVGQNAFKNSGIYALDIPSAVQTFAGQESVSLAYVFFRGSQTAVTGNTAAKYVFAPTGSAAAAWATEAGVTFVDSASITAQGGFYYQVSGGTATLLCPVDALEIPESVIIPATVGQASVTALSANAFMQCSQLKRIVLPKDVTVADGAYADCPDAVVVTAGVTQLVLSSYSIKLNNENPTATLAAEVISDTLTDKSVTYDSLDDWIVDVSDEGKLTAVSNGTTYVFVTAADGTAAQCRVEVDMGQIPVSITSVPSTAAIGKAFDFTLSSDNGLDASHLDDAYVTLDLTYFDASGLPVSYSSRGYLLDNASETYSIVPSHSNAVKLTMNVNPRSSKSFIPGKTSTATISLTPNASAAPVLDVMLSYGSGCPGSYAQVYVAVTNPESLTKAETVTVTSPDGYVNTTLGTVTRDNPSVYGDVMFPLEWEYATSDDTDNYLTISVGNAEPVVCGVWLDGLYVGDVNVNVGETYVTSQNSYCSFTDQLPLTFSVADPSIATISSTGSITGVSEGVTTATVTTKTGHSKQFKIKVSNGAPVSAPDGEVPTLSLFAPYKSLNWSANSGYYELMFVLIPDTPGMFLNDESHFELSIDCYDANHEFIGTASEMAYPNNGRVAEVYENADYLHWRLGYEPATPEERIHYIEAHLVESDSYKIGAESEASVSFTYSDTGSSDESVLDFEYFVSDYSAGPGGSISVEVTCVNPEKMTKSVTVSLLPIYDAYSLTPSAPVTLTKENPSGVITVTVAEDALPGLYLSYCLYADTLLIGEDGVSVHEPYGLLEYSMSIAEGKTARLPLLVSNSVTIEDFSFWSFDDSVASVDQNGIVTAHSQGEAIIFFRFNDKYNLSYGSTIPVQVYQNESEDLPTLSISSPTVSTDYGKSLLVTLTLDGPMPVEIDPNYANPYFDYDAILLDSSMRIINNRRITVNCSEEELLNGFTTEFFRWPSGSTYSDDAKYLYLTIPKDPYYDAPRFNNSDVGVLIEVNYVPEKDLYSIIPYTSQSYRLGDSFDGFIERYRVKQNITANNHWALKLADGSLLDEGTIWGYNEDSDFSIYLDNRFIGTIGQEITAYLYVDGEKTDVTVSFPVLPPKIYISNLISTMWMDETFTIEYFFSVDDSYGYTSEVTYSSSNENIVTIDSEGNMTAIGAGEVTITVTTADGQTDSMTVTVLAPQLTIYAPNRMLPNESCVIEYYFDVDESSDYTCAVSFSSSDESVITVDESGTLTAVGIGSATLTATGADGQTFSQQVHVIDSENLVLPTMYVTGESDSFDWFQFPTLKFGTETELFRVEDMFYIEYVYEFLDASGKCIELPADTHVYYYFDLSTPENSYDLYLDNDIWLSAFEAGAVQLRIKLLESDDYLLDEERGTFTFDLTPNQEYPDPVVAYAATTKITNGRTFSVTFTCLNPHVLADVPRVVSILDSNWSEVASFTLNATSSQATLTYELPEGWQNGYDYVIISGFMNADNKYYTLNPQIVVPPTIVTSLAELQSEHDYQEYADQTWRYVYEGATCLDVTFDERTYTEESYDFVTVYSAEDWSLDIGSNRYSGGELAGQTISIDGDTLILQLTSDSSVTYWGFAVTKIVAHMPDGSLVTITE